uniref:Transmembrane protein n=1 Tax=Angiostrongylus cantonensis TaxID=6313 RepID=A0A0K0CY40_ANGCA
MFQQTSSFLLNGSSFSVAKQTNKVPATERSFSGLVFLSLVLFIAAVAVIGKIIYSNRRRRSDLIGGTARWRLATSHQSGVGPQQTAASYAPMGGRRQGNERNGLDTPGPDRLDWERQFFDDTEATVRFLC